MGKENSFVVYPEFITSIKPLKAGLSQCPHCGSRRYYNNVQICDSQETLQTKNSFCQYCGTLFVDNVTNKSKVLHNIISSLKKEKKKNETHYFKLAKKDKPQLSLLQNMNEQVDKTDLNSPSVKNGCK